MKKIDMTTKAAKYFVAHNLKGLNKAQAAREAKMSVTNTTNMEKTDTYKALEHKYADHIQDKIGMGEVAEEHRKVIMQDENPAAKNAAIKMFLDRVEPEAQKIEDDNQMIVVLRG